MSDESACKASIDAADSVLLFLAGVEKKNALTLPQWFMKALATLTKELAEQSVPAEKLTFTPEEVFDWLEKYSDKPINAGNKGVSAYIADLSKKAIKSLEDDVQIKNMAIERELAFYGQFGTKRGGGSKNKNEYLILSLEITPEESKNRDKLLLPHSIPEGGLLYREVKERATPLLARWMNGIDLKGKRLFLFLFFIMLPFVVLMLLLLSPLLLFVAPGLGQMVGKFIFWGITYLAVMAVFFGFLYRMVDKRVAMAPDWMTLTSNEYWLLEYRREKDQDGGYSHRRIALVLYSGDCPVCNGVVRVARGGFHFPGRLVGRCDESPVEHVFSFDHVSRVGKPLR